MASENEWVKAAQQKLKQGANYHHLVKKFGLQKDQNGIVRCKGHLEYSKLRPDARDPIILPKEHPITLLQVQECHTRVLHGCVRSTLAELRTRFWVTKGRQVVKYVLNHWVVCKKMEGKSLGPPSTASLPDWSGFCRTFIRER